MAKKKLKKKGHQVEIKRTIGRDRNGVPIRKSFYGETKDDAVLAYLEYMEKTPGIVKVDKSILLSQWVVKWLKIYKQPNVKETTFLTTYQRPCELHIVPYFEGVRLCEVQPIHIQGFLNSISGYSQSLIDKILLCMREIFETAVDNDLIAKNPFRKVKCKSKKQPGVKRVYDQESVDELCKVDHKYALYIEMLLRLGLRCSELCGLRWEDIDFDRGTVHISQALTTESGYIYIDKPKSETSDRELKIPVELLVKLKDKRSTGYIAMLNGRHIKPDHFGDRQLEAFYNAAGVPRNQRLSAHELRHTCGTLLYEKTRDIYHVSRFLGHSDVKITSKTYVHSEMSKNKKVHIDFEAGKSTKTPTQPSKTESTCILRNEEYN